MRLDLKLAEIRKLRGLTQAEAARLSGVGVKTISSFETGERIKSIKVHQLRRLLRVYGMTEAEFFGQEPVRPVARPTGDFAVEDYPPMNGSPRCVVFTCDDGKHRELSVSLEVWGRRVLRFVPGDNVTSPFAARRKADLLNAAADYAEKIAEER